MNWSWYRLLHTASDVIPKLPGKEDTRLTTFVKLLGVWDSVQQHMGLIPNLLQRFFKTLGKEVVPHDNRHFVDLFFGTKIVEEFDVRRVALDQHSTVIYAKSASLGEIFFVENWSTTISSEFWVAPDYDFANLMDTLWAVMDGRIHMAMTMKNYNMKTEVSQVPPVRNSLLGKAEEQLAKFVERHRRFTEAKIPRTYLFLGMQGVGKSSFALRVGQRLGGRILRIDATSVTHVGAQDLDFILRILQPGFTLIDDIDKAPDLVKCMPTLLTTLADLQVKYPAMTIILTANSAELGPALVRPERIDEVIDFEPPEAEERALLLRGFMGDLFTEKQIEEFNLKSFIKATEGLSAPYLKEIVHRLRVDTPQEVFAYIERMKKLATPPKEEEETKGVPTPKA